MSIIDKFTCYQNWGPDGYQFEYEVEEKAPVEETGTGYWLAGSWYPTPFTVDFSELRPKGDPIKPYAPHENVMPSGGSDGSVEPGIPCVKPDACVSEVGPLAKGIEPGKGDFTSIEKRILDYHGVSYKDIDLLIAKGVERNPCAEIKLNRPVFMPYLDVDTEGLHDELIKGYAQSKSEGANRYWYQNWGCVSKKGLVNGEG